MWLCRGSVCSFLAMLILFIVIFHNMSWQIYFDYFQGGRPFSITFQGFVIIFQNCSRLIMISGFFQGSRPFSSTLY